MYHIIVNKKSRSGRGEKLWPVIEGELERRRTEFRVYPTKYHGSARETAARLTAKGVWNPDDVLLAIGGDGTANEAVEWNHQPVGCKVRLYSNGKRQRFCARCRNSLRSAAGAGSCAERGGKGDQHWNGASWQPKSGDFSSAPASVLMQALHEALASKIKNTLNRLHLGNLRM